MAESKGRKLFVCSPTAKPRFRYPAENENCTFRCHRTELVYKTPGLRSRVVFVRDKVKAEKRV